ncbi:GNAT family N-acetyltransferase [Sphingomonas oligoaromativorans]|uniref:GNAT family N-acetyltransferase n=1 Tax=Sphingomonas oligoaromativorans TaxID=575322 RepID=UPI001422D37A|nr:GNAT family N-acetyltransferase [Sphingomonas oligoaromativorans]NIJ31688.1 GNAT superfamily N-acetyltransferase [Sphingomonas oligoaromativorans]
MSLTAVPEGQLATIVTSLQMLERPKARPMPPSNLRLDRWREPAPDRYRALFRRVGEPWLWFSRLVIGDAALTAIIHDPAVEVYAVTDLRGIELGLLELDFRNAGNCEIAYFGLVPELTGQGEGRWLMAQTLALGWRKGVERMWVHTCTLDHPKALNFYRAQGFVPFARSVETFIDPRLAGLAPASAAPHIPLIGEPFTEASSRR